MGADGVLMGAGGVLLGRKQRERHHVHFECDTHHADKHMQPCIAAVLQPCIAAVLQLCIATLLHVPAE